MEDASITASFIWTFEEVKARHAALSGRPVSSTKGFTMVSVVVTILLIVATIALVSTALARQKLPFFAAQNNTLSIAVYLLPIFVMGITFMFVQRNNLKRGFLQSPDHDKRVVVTFTTDEIIMKVENIYET